MRNLLSRRSPKLWIILLLFIVLISVYEYNKKDDVPIVISSDHYREFEKRQETVYPSYFFKRYTPKNILQLEPPSYLSNYKNPCWLESSELKSPCQNESCSMALRHSTTMLCLPRVFLAGFPKCGTTDLAFTLSKHPDVHYVTKETHFWTRKGFMHGHSINEYSRKYFPITLYKSCSYRMECMAKQQFLDASPSTLWYNAYHDLYQNGTEAFDVDPKMIVAHHIHHVLPMSKVIVIMRDPVANLYSAYFYFDEDKPRSPSLFHKEVVRGIKNFNKCLQTESIRKCIYPVNTKRRSSLSQRGRLRVGIYVYYLEDWFRVHGKENIHCMRLEDYSQNKRHHMDNLFKFLDLDNPPEIIWKEIESDEKKYNKNRKKRKRGPMLNKTRNLLRKFYKPYNEALASLLNDRAYLWDY